MSASAAPEFGPRYRPVRQLGGGGMGTVWLVRDGFLDRELALKVLNERPVDAAEFEQV